MQIVIVTAYMPVLLELLVVILVLLKCYRSRYYPSPKFELHQQSLSISLQGQGHRRDNFRTMKIELLLFQMGDVRYF